ncbi:MAG: DinB family protein [Leptospira sp.]|nr:DinB family protein [Leptospira sp.]
MDKKILVDYETEASLLSASLEGLSENDLTSFPIPGTWSIQEIVVHLMDSELVSAHRMKRVIAENNPLLIGYDETAFSKNLFYDKTDTKMACEIFRINRLIMSGILKNLPEIAFSRTGVHSESGRLILGNYLESNVDHLRHHLKYLKEKRKLLGK